MKYESPISFGSKVIAKVKFLWTDRQTDGQTDRRTGWFLYTPQTSFAGGINNNTVQVLSIITYLLTSWNYYDTSSFQQDVFVKHGCPPAATKSKYDKIVNVLYFARSLKCEQPLNELTVKVWLLYHYPNFKYCTSYVSKTELQTIWLLDAQAGGMKIAPPPPPAANLSGWGHKNHHLWALTYLSIASQFLLSCLLKSRKILKLILLSVNKT